MSAKTFFLQECQLFVSVGQGNSLPVTAKNGRQGICIVCWIYKCFFSNNSTIYAYFLTSPNSAPCGLVNNKPAIISKMFEKCKECVGKRKQKKVKHE